MTFRIPEAGDEVRFFRPHAQRARLAIVRRVAIVADGQIAADLRVAGENGVAYGVAGVRYRDATPHPTAPGMYWEFCDDDDEDVG